MYDLNIIYDSPKLNGYNYEEYFYFMEAYMEYCHGLEHIQSAATRENDDDWFLLENHLRFIIKQTINKEHRDLLNLGDSVYIIWSKLKLAEANFNRVMHAQTLSHQIINLRQAILKRISYEKELIKTKKRKLELDEDDGDDEVKMIKRIVKTESS